MTTTVTKLNALRRLTFVLDLVPLQSYRSPRARPRAQFPLPDRLAIRSATRPADFSEITVRKNRRQTTLLSQLDNKLAVRAEFWLIADNERICSFLGHELEHAPILSASSTVPSRGWSMREISI
jgi:hypothetical protein